MDRCFQTCDDWIATHSTSTMTVGIDATIPKYPARFRAKVIGSLVAVSVLSALAGSGMYVMRHRRLISSDFSERGRFLVSGLADQVVIGLLSGNTDFLDRPLKAVLSRADSTPTLIFDEIDQGIGGRVGATVGDKLWRLTVARDGGGIPELVEAISAHRLHLEEGRGESGYPVVVGVAAPATTPASVPPGGI